MLFSINDYIHKICDLKSDYLLETARYDITSKEGGMTPKENMYYSMISITAVAMLLNINDNLTCYNFNEGTIDLYYGNKTIDVKYTHYPNGELRYTKQSDMKTDYVFFVTQYQRRLEKLIRMRAMLTREQYNKLMENVEFNPKSQKYGIENHLIPSLENKKELYENCKFQHYFIPLWEESDFIQKTTNVIKPKRTKKKQVTTEETKNTIDEVIINSEPAKDIILPILNPTLNRYKFPTKKANV